MRGVQAVGVGVGVGGLKKKIRRAWSGSVETRGARGAEAVGIYADADVC